MSESQPDYWFPAKTYGWGWGLPVKWQGWLVLIVYLGLVLWGLRVFELPREVRGLLIYQTALTALLIVGVAIKGERPRWRWGGE